MQNRFEKYKVNDTSENNKFQKYLVQQENADSSPEMVNTFLGKMPAKLSEFQSGTPENKALVEDLIGGFAGIPGMKLLSSGIGKGAKGVKNTISAARTNLEPTKEALEKSSQGVESLEEQLGAQQEKSNAFQPLSETATPELQNIEEQIGQHLNLPAEHSVRAASALKNRVGSIENFWSDSYKRFEDKLRNNQFQMPEQAMGNLGYDEKEILKRLQKGADPKKVIEEMEKEAKNPYFEGLKKSAPTSTDTSAADFLAKFRDFRDTLGGLKQDLKSERYGSLEKKQISEAIQKGKEMEGQIKDVLHEGLGEHKPEFDWLMKGYSEQVFPLRKNPLVKAAKQGKLPDNILKSLRTNEPGMPLLRDIVRQDPELLRNVVGQRYKAKPSEIHAPNELTREYLNEMPEFGKLVKQRESALQKAAEQKNISLKEKMRLENQVKEIKNAKELAKKEKTKLEQQYKQIKSTRSKARKKLLIGSGVGLSAIGAPYGAIKGAKLFSNE